MYSNNYEHRDTMPEKKQNILIEKGKSGSLIVAILLALAVAGVVPCMADGTKTITDMAGRELTIPDPLNHVLSTYPPTSEMIFMLAPDKLMGWQSDSKRSKYMKDQYKNLPVVGGWYGGITANYETFLSMKPDAIFEGFSRSGSYMDTINQRQDNLKPIPLIEVSETGDVNNYTPAIDFMGKTLGAEEKAGELKDFYNRVYTRVKDTASTIPETERKRVYYAEGVEGLSTEPNNSHAQLIALCGGTNVASGVAAQGGMGETPVTPEQILSWNPDVIIVREPRFYAEIYSDPNWASIKAVKDKQVYLAPNDPFGWFDRPPCVNTIIGIPWLAKVLYPDKFSDLNLKDLTREFYSKFYSYDLSDQELDDLISGSGLTNY